MAHAWNGCSQSSRFPTAGQGERSSGNEIVWDADCLSEEHEVSDMASYLQVDTDTWFDWSEELEAREE